MVRKQYSQFCGKYGGWLRTPYLWEHGPYLSHKMRGTLSTQKVAPINGKEMKMYQIPALYQELYINCLTKLS